MIDLYNNNKVPPYLWKVKRGRYGSSGHTLFISKTLCRATNLIKKENGFKYSKQDNLWYNDEASEWYSITKVDYLP